MTAEQPSALIADDEPLLRKELERLLSQVWPELEIVARARNGREAVEMFEKRRPDVCFLDVKMPGKSGVEAAAEIGQRAHLVFVTAYDKYAVQAFAQGVLDYLVKPVEPARLGETVTRLRERLRTAEPASNTASVLRDLATSLKADVAAEPLRWVRASAGRTVRLIPVESIDFLRADQKYTRVAWRDDDGLPREDLIRLALRDIGEKLDRSQFIRVHRSVVVNLMSIDHVVHGANETADIHLKGRDEILPVSRTYMHHFRQM